MFINLNYSQKLHDPESENYMISTKIIHNSSYHLCYDIFHLYMTASLSFINSYMLLLLAVFDTCLTNGS